MVAPSPPIGEMFEHGDAAARPLPTYRFDLRHVLPPWRYSSISGRPADRHATSAEAITQPAMP